MTAGAKDWQEGYVNGHRPKDAADRIWDHD